MILPQSFEPFVKGAPCAVMARALAEWIVDEQLLGELFDDYAVAQYERQITIDHLVVVMLDVACGIEPSVRASFLKWKDHIQASPSAFYGKLERMEPELGMALVAHTAERLAPLIGQLNAWNKEPLPRYASYILDGNVLAGTEHRLLLLRQTRAAALPGKSLVLFQCATGLVTQTVLWEDAHAQERALLPQLALPAGIHLIADRNFCVRWLLQELAQSGSHFTIRHHQQFVIPAEAARRKVGRCATGMVYQRCWKEIDDAGQVQVWRAVTIELDEPTRDGDLEITLITNLPLEVDARNIAEAYRHRWVIEGHFQRMTEHLHCEISSLGQPRAALFAFAMSLMAGNLLAVVIATIRAVQGDDLADNVSYYYLVHEVASIYRGMMLALPAQQWEFIQALSDKQVAQLLKHVAQYIDPRRFRKTRRGPKQKKHTPNCRNIRHLATQRLLEQHY